jgi:uncharacterized protein
MTRNWNQLLMDDHQAAENVIAALERGFEKSDGPEPALIGAAVDFFTVYLEGCHHKKEEQYLFLRMEQRGIPTNGGPLAVMLNEHDRNRELLGQFERIGTAYARGDRSQLRPLRQVFQEYADLMKQHFWKENDILYPMAQKVLSEADSEAILEGIASCENALGLDTRNRYYALAEDLKRQGQVQDLSVALDRNILACILNTLPVELSFVDAEDIVQYFSHENLDKIFPRGRSSIGMKVENCHPQKSVHKVRQIISDFREGRRDSAAFWIDFAGKKVHIRYFAVRDEQKQYLGCLEVVQDITPIQSIKGERRLVEDS